MSKSCCSVKQKLTAAIRKEHIAGVGYDYNGTTMLTVCFTTNLKDLDKWLHISDNEILIDDAANNVLFKFKH